MKKIICVLVLVCCLVVFASCNGNLDEEVDMSKVMETANTVYDVTGNAGSITIDESVAVTLLEIYSQEALGLAEPIGEYDLKLSATRFMDKDACLVEAFSSDNKEKPEGTFIILGQQCFVYNVKQQEYLLLTPNGAVEFESDTASVTGEQSSTTESSFVYDEDNNKKLHKRFDSYGKKKLGLDKEISEYILVVPGTTTTAENGETVYVIRLYEKTGEVTNHTVAFNDDGNYVFDYEVNRYVKL